MKERFIPIGPVSIPFVPSSHIEQIDLPKEMVDQLWKIIGPTIEEQINKEPLWRLFVSCYVQGLQHGSSSVKESK